MHTIQLDIPNNILIIAAGTGIYNSLTITELVADNSEFWIEENTLYTKTPLIKYLIAGTVGGSDYIRVFDTE